MNTNDSVGQALASQLAEMSADMRELQDGTLPGVARDPETQGRARGSE